MSAHRRPHASLPTLILELRSDDLANVLAALVEERLGAGHSLYQQIDSFGIETCVDYLWSRAAPTCFLDGRDDPNFGLSPTDEGILRLPPATCPVDEEIRSRLAAAFQARSKHVHVDQGGDEDHEVTVMRIKLGFVIGIEAANTALLHATAMRRSRTTFRTC